eukprot:1460148-Alexandrium_andersonii.AAC.1
MWLPEHVAEEAAAALMVAAVHHQTLCHRCVTSNRQLWYVTEKLHMVQHLAGDIRESKCNARFAWANSDEDY